MKDYIKIKADAMKETNEISMKGEIVVFGSTYMSNFPLYELSKKLKFENAIYNRSIEGLTIDEASEILHGCVIEIKPSKIFLSLGEEDENDPSALDKYNRLVSELRTALPDAVIYLICLQGDDRYSESFNKNIRSLCDGKKIRYIKFVSSSGDAVSLYKARFKQLSCFFHNRPLNMADAFAIAEL